MDLAQRYTNVGVIGAAGKMGSGIALLLTHEMALRKTSPGAREKRFKLTLMDVNDEALDGLKGYLRSQMRRLAEKSTVRLRAHYADRPDLVENGEIIQAYVDDALDLARFTTDLDQLAGCRLVFEAIAENIDLKVKIYKQVKKLAPEAFIFTNTSSIPIRLLDEQAGLGGGLVGFHFYNPPAVQRLLELITSPTTRDDLVADAQQIAKDLKKKVIPASDIAGFIGNGHFIRDGLHGIAEMEKLRGDYGFAGGTYMVNRVSQDWLIRPMGIFQLIDYVGVDVFQCILGVMNQFIEGEELHSDLIDELMKRGVRGGQNPDGSQKDGFFRYEKGQISAVYDLDKGDYQPIAAAWSDRFDKALGGLPDGHFPWRVLSRDTSKTAKLEGYFGNLAKAEGLGARLGRDYLKRSKEIGEQLVSSGVAAKAEDVNGVLLNGFFHLYGPINDYA